MKVVDALIESHEKRYWLGEFRANNTTYGVLGWIQYHQTSLATFHSPKHHTPSVYRTAQISRSVDSSRFYQCSKSKQFLPDGSIEICI